MRLAASSLLVLALLSPLTVDNGGDGKLLVRCLEGEEGWGLYLADPDGTKVERLLGPSRAVPYHRLSPDRKSVLFQRESGVEEPGTLLRPWFLAVLDSETRSTFDLERHTRGHCWSQDGQRIFYGRPAANGETEIVSVKADGTDRQTLFSLPRVAYVEDCSRNGRTLLLTIESDALVELPPVREREKDVYSADLDGKHMANLTQNPAMDKRPRFSPDGTKVLFVSTRSGTSQLHVMDADGNNVKQLTSFPGEPGRLSGAIYGCAWSPDGQRVAYSWTWFPPRDREPSVTYIANADGTGAWSFRQDTQEPDWR